MSPPSQTLLSVPDKQTWYSDAVSYWEQVEPSVNGMLGGYESLTELDAADSTAFVQEITDKIPSDGLLCDCGAGIGRVTESFLVRAFSTSFKIDLVEQNPAFLEKARVRFTEIGCIDRIGQFIPSGLQDFEPEKDRYSLIWTQWVLGHLTDEDLISFLERCKAALKPDGFIGIKENVTKSGIQIDEEDSSCTRSDVILKKIFKKAGLTLLKEARQTGFPKQLYTVKMYLLQ